MHKERPPYLMMTPQGFYGMGEEPVIPTLAGLKLWLRTYGRKLPLSRVARTALALSWKCLIHKAQESSLHSIPTAGLSESERR